MDLEGKGPTLADGVLEELRADRPAWSVARNASKLVGGMTTPEICFDLDKYRKSGKQKKVEKKKKERTFGERARIQAVFDMKTVREIRAQTKRRKLLEKLKRGDPQAGFFPPSPNPKFHLSHSYPRRRTAFLTRPARHLLHNNICCLHRTK